MRTRYDNAGRVQPTHYGNLIHPGTCLLCNRIGTSPDEVFANLGVDLEYYGMAYLCLNCCAEIADFICFVTPESIEKLSALYSTLREDRDSLYRQLQEAKGLINARISSAGSGESLSDGSVNLTLFEVEPDTAFIDSILDSHKSESTESGS